MRWRIPVVALIVTALPVRAQVVRGVVTERVSGARVPGVVVTVASVGDSLRPTRHALTNSRGEYAVTLPGAGVYQLSAKRIGVERYEAPVMTLATGETKRLDIVLARFDYKLPAVRVAANNLCIPRQGQFRTIVALWDEVRTALLAAEISREEHLISGWLTVYNRSLMPQSLRILQDQRSVSEGLFDRPMRSISGDSLALVGFWRTLAADTLVFYGPDAGALLSDAFQSSHCFELVNGRDRNRGMHGLEFRPRRSRNTGDISGTIWIDAGNFELRFVEFRYTNLITIPRNPHLGGEVHFLRHESGAWVVRRWFIRMPQFPTITPSIGGAGFARSRPLPNIYRIIEQGGGLFVPQLRGWEKPGFVEGVIVDSTGRRPLREAVVSLSGTPYSTEVDAEGRFRFDSIPPGAYTLLASHRDYADLGQLADDDPLNVVAGQTYASRMKAASTADLLKILCNGNPVDPTRGTLRVIVLHTDSGTAISGALVALRWLSPIPVDTSVVIQSPLSDGPDDGQSTRMRTGLQTITDSTGAATFCGVPAGQRLDFSAPRWGQPSAFVRSFTLRPGEVAGETVRIRPPQ